MTGGVRGCVERLVDKNTKMSKLALIRVLTMELPGRRTYNKNAGAQHQKVAEQRGRQRQEI